MIEYGSELILHIFTMFSLILLLFARKIEGNHFTPASAWCLSWFVLFFLTSIFGTVYEFSISGLSTLMLLIFAFPVGGFLAALPRGLGGIANPHPALMKLPPIYIDIAGIAFGLYGVYDLRKGFASAGYGSSDFLASAAENASAIYSGDYVLPVSANFGYSFMLVAAYTIALRFVFSERKLMPTFLLAILAATALLWTFTTTTRIYFGMILLWTFCGFISARVLLGKPINLLQRKVILRFTMVFIPFFFFTIFVQSVRLSKGDAGDLSTAFDHMRPWLGGTISAFCIWLNDSWTDPYTLGAYLFRAPLKLIGIETQDRFTSFWIGNGQLSNATTMLRGFIQDFGILGAFIFVSSMGFASIKCYISALSGSMKASMYLSILYVVAFFAPNNWIFLYGTRIYAFLLMYAVVTMFGARRRFSKPNST